jgi:hypothetical protein
VRRSAVVSKRRDYAAAEHEHADEVGGVSLRHASGAVIIEIFPILFLPRELSARRELATLAITMPQLAGLTLSLSIFPRGLSNEAPWVVRSCPRIMIRDSFAGNERWCPCRIRPERGARPLCGIGESRRCYIHGLFCRTVNCFYASHDQGSTETPSCTTCHTRDPKNLRQTRAGKEILPLAVSRTPDRFTDFDRTEKWFGRN